MHTLRIRFANTCKQAGNGFAEFVYREPTYVISFVILSVLLISPLWTLTYLPLGDLPDHAAQLRVITDYAHYKDVFQINWFTPYLLSYAVTLLIAVISPVTVAIKITLSLFLLAVPISSAWLIQTLKGNKYWVWTSFPVAFGFSFYWGFFSFVVATPVAIAFFAFVNAYSSKPLNVRAVLTAALFSGLLFFSHGLAWAFSILMAVSILILNGHFKAIIWRILPFLLILPVVFTWTAGPSPSPSSPVELGGYTQRYVDKVMPEIQWIIKDFNNRTEKGEHLQRLKEIFSMAIGMPAMMDFVLLAIFLIIWPWLIGARFAKDWRRYLPVTTVALCFMIVPYWIQNTAYVYYRFSTFLIPASLFCFSFTPNVETHRSWLVSLRHKLLWSVGFVVVMFVLSITSSSFKQFRQNDQDFKQILAAMQPDKCVLQLIFDQESPFKYSAPYLHYGAWYQAEKRGTVLPSFPYDIGAPNVPVHYSGKPWEIPSGWDPNSFNWLKHEGFRYDYFLVRAYNSKQYLFAAAGDSITLIRQQGAWQLYGRKNLVR